MHKDSKPGSQKANRRREIFAREYLKDLNGTRAAIAAGYSEKTAQEAASRLLSNAMVQKRIKELLDKKIERLDITVEGVLGELRKMGFANMQDYVRLTEDGLAALDVSKVTRDQWAAVQEMTSDTAGTTVDPNWSGGEGGPPKVPVIRNKIKLADKRGSLELLGKYLKLFTDRVAVGSADGGPIAVRIVTNVNLPEEL